MLRRPRARARRRQQSALRCSGDVLWRMDDGDEEEETFTDVLQQLRAVWQQVDTDGNGTLDQDELRTVLLRMGYVEGDDFDLAFVMQQIDTDKSGAIDFAEFVAWFNRQGEEAQGKLFVVYYCDSAGDQVVYQNSCAPLVLPPFTRPASRSSRRSESWRSCKPKGALP